MFGSKEGRIIKLIEEIKNHIYEMEAESNKLANKLVPGGVGTSCPELGIVRDHMNEAIKKIEIIKRIDSKLRAIIERELGK